MNAKTPATNKTLVKSLKTRIKVLTEELATCTTTAMRACVQGGLDAAHYELDVAEGRATRPTWDKYL